MPHAGRPCAGLGYPYVHSGKSKVRSGSEGVPRSGRRMRRAWAARARRAAVGGGFGFGFGARCPQDIVEADLFKAQMPSVTWLRLDGARRAASGALHPSLACASCGHPAVRTKAAGLVRTAANGGLARGGQWRACTRRPIVGGVCRLGEASRPVRDRRAVQPRPVDRRADAHDAGRCVATKGRTLPRSTASKRSAAAARSARCCHAAAAPGLAGRCRYGRSIAAWTAPWVPLEYRSSTGGAGGRAWSELDGCGHGDLFGARLEPDEGPAGDVSHPFIGFQPL